MTKLVSFREYGRGSPLLLIHGLMVVGEMFAPIVDTLARRHRAIIPDLRGHGRSRSLPPPYTVSALAADLARLFDHLGIESASVLGYSQGGAVAQQFAFDYPDRCDRLVLACTYAFNMASVREKIEGHLAPALIRILGMRRFAKLVVSQGAKELPRDRGEWLASLMASQDQSLMVRAWKAAMAFDGRPRLGEIRCPTLIIAGSSDTAVPMHHAKMLAAGIPDSRLVMVDGAGHTLIWTHPEPLLKAVEEFLA